MGLAYTVRRNFALSCYNIRKRYAGRMAYRFLTDTEPTLPCLPSVLYPSRVPIRSIARSGCVCRRVTGRQPTDWRVLPVPAGGSGTIFWPGSSGGTGPGARTVLAPCPTVSFFGLGKEFTALRRDPGHDWLRQYGHKEVKYILKYLADAYRAFLRGRWGCPRFKARHRDGFTIPSHVTIRDSRLRVPKAGWCRLRGRNPYAGCHPLQVRIRQEGTPARSKWYVYLTCAVPATQVKSGAHTGITGLDRNVGQCTDSTGTMYRMTDTARLDARLRRKQR